MFMPVGTQATVKGVFPRDLREMSAQMILANTYHLYLRPSDDLILRKGGLHRFINWDGPILTDSGGFQVFSLSGMRKLDDDGVTFRSHRDGSKHRFTPERSIQIQHNLGADVIMCFDECPPSGDHAYVKDSLRRTHPWAVRSRDEHERLCAHGPSSNTYPHTPSLFGIVQGGIYEDLRTESAQFMTGLNFPGYAIGGLAVGENKPDTDRAVSWMDQLLPIDKPRYLMGVGDPLDLLHGVARGVDMFDCVLPTRLARHGAAFTADGRINMRNKVFEEDERPIDPSCTCPACSTHTRAYIRHLLHVEETLGMMLMSIHNLHFLLTLMRQIRASVNEGRFTAFAAKWEDRYVGQPA